MYRNLFSYTNSIKTLERKRELFILLFRLLFLTKRLKTRVIKMLNRIQLNLFDEAEVVINPVIKRKSAF